MHSTNYYNTFIEIAEDCPVKKGEMPPQKKAKKTVANLQFEMLINSPYQFTSDEVLFTVFAQRKEFGKEEIEAERIQYFSKGQPCFRTSPLTKRYGWGVHYNAKGKLAIFGAETKEYHGFLLDDTVEKVRAMKSKR
jgi:hypothetical protein